MASGEKTCGTCRWWHDAMQMKVVGGRVHQVGAVCRRHPPVPLVFSIRASTDAGGVTYIENDMDTYWPEVGEGDWCGEWEWRG